MQSVKQMLRQEYVKKYKKKYLQRITSFEQNRSFHCMYIIDSRQQSPVSHERFQRTKKKCFLFGKTPQTEILFQFNKRCYTFGQQKEKSNEKVIKPYGFHL